MEPMATFHLHQLSGGELGIYQSPNKLNGLARHDLYLHRMELLDSQTSFSQAPPSASSMDNDVRFGVELETLLMDFTFSKFESVNKNKLLWTAVGAEGFPLSRNDPILVPLSADHTLDNVKTLKSSWKRPFGFLVTGDNFIRNHGEGPKVSKCHFELNSSATYTSDVDHWAFFRQATRAFAHCLCVLADALPDFTSSREEFPIGVARTKNWHSLETLVAEYNKKVDELTADMGFDAHKRDMWVNNWKLKKSAKVEALEADAGGNWHGFISLTGSRNELQCDSQVNYEITLDSFAGGSKFTNWLDAWSHQWISATRTPTSMAAAPVDAPCGFQRYKEFVPLDLVYGNTFLQALWKAANAAAVQFLMRNDGPFAGLPNTPSAALFKSNLTGLLTIIFACSAVVTTDGMEEGAKKNSYVQLSKTSLVSMVHKMFELHADIKDIKARLHLFSTGEVSQLAADVISDLRRLPTISKFLPPTAPALALKDHPYASPPALAIDSFDRDLAPSKFVGAKVEEFNRMWANVFSYDGPLDDHAPHDNCFGYQTTDPFFCPWALAHTSQPAEIFETVQGTDRVHKIKILFESRIALNWLNLGLNPDVQDEFFHIAYASLASMTPGGTGVKLSDDMLKHKLKPAGTLESNQAIFHQLNVSQKEGFH